MVGWLVAYTAAPPGVRAGDNATVMLDLDNEVQPDALLRVKQGGKSHITEDDYLEGAPELVVEIAASSVSYDLHIKEHVYQRNGVQEYLAVQVYDERADWFILRDGVYESSTPDDAGVLRSDVFPGLRLQPEAFWSDDLAAMLATLQQGLASEEHATFVARLETKNAERRRKSVDSPHRAG
ncbi:MAG: Uma2 family endonuclease [Armatimonadetes bacterium]|nr:Uma2 family endonuclease [Armatimonadota bacterium]